MPKTILVWVLTVPAAGLFLLVGLANVFGAQQALQVWGDNSGLRVFIGVSEVTGAIGLLVPRLAFWASTLLALLMLGAIYPYVAQGLGLVPLLVLLLLAASIGALRFPQALFLGQAEPVPGEAEPGSEA